LGAVPKFTPAHNDLELLAIVRQVADRAAPDDPLGVSGPVWDKHRDVAGRGDTPRASSVARRFGLSWSDVLRVAYADRSDALRQLNTLRADKGRKNIKLTGVVLALRQAAVRLDQQELDRSDYTRARKQILAPSARTRHAHIAEKAIPSLTQVEEVLRQNDMSWEDVVRRAGLRVPTTSKGTHGLLIREAVAAFVEDTGKLPRGSGQVRDWASARSVPLRRSHGEQLAGPTEHAIAEIVAARKAAGEPELPVADVHEQFTGTRPVTDKRPQKKDWNRESLITGMALATRELPPGAVLSQRELKRIAAHRRDLPIPSYSVINRHLRRSHPGETWEEWRDEAARLARVRDQPGQGTTTSPPGDKPAP
jgi:hypothetical protein